jgi:hypothetical protein
MIPAGEPLGSILPVVCMSVTFPSAGCRCGNLLLRLREGSSVAGTKLSVRSPFGLADGALRELASQER